MSKLQELLESKLLNDETKTVLKESWDQAVAANRIELEAEYATKFNESKEELQKDAVAMVEEVVTGELENLAEELAHARSLEVQYATKLSEFKESYADKTNELIASEVQSIVKEELDELKEDIDFAKQHQFAMSMFESYREVYGRMFGESDTNIHQELEEAKNELDGFRRESLMNRLLESVAGDKRGVISTILESVPTDKLEARFESLAPVIMSESVGEENKGSTVLTEGKVNDKAPEGQVILESQVTPDENTGSKVNDLIARSLRYIK